MRPRTRPPIMVLAANHVVLKLGGVVQLMRLLVILSLFVILIVLWQQYSLIDDIVYDPTHSTTTTTRTTTINSTLLMGKDSNTMDLTFESPSLLSLLTRRRETASVETTHKNEKNNKKSPPRTHTITTRSQSHYQLTSTSKRSSSSFSKVVYNCQIQNQTIELPISKQHFIIAGAQKSGTSALYYFLREHPNLSASSSMETHFFDWYYPSSGQKSQWMVDRNLTTESEFQCAIKQAYWDMFNSSTYYNNNDTLSLSLSSSLSSSSSSSSSSTIITFEKTPSYLFLSRIPKLIHETLSSSSPSSLLRKPKIIVILRNPIDRAFSHFRMGAGKLVGNNGQSFDNLVNQEIKSMRDLGLSHAPPLRLPSSSSLSSSSSLKLQSSSSEVQHQFHNNNNSSHSLILSFESPNLTKSESDAAHWKHYRKMFANNYLQRSMYVTQLERWIQYFPLQESLLVLNYEQFLSNPHIVYQKILNFVEATPTSFIPPNGFDVLHNSGGHQKIKTNEMKKTSLQTPSSSSSLLLLHNETRQYLSSFFHPYNSKLADLLGEEWRDVWT